MMEPTNGAGADPRPAGSLTVMMSTTTAWTPGAVLALLLLSPGRGGADQVEVSGWVGPSLPFYSQSFRYQPPPVPSLPGVSVEQVGEFRFDASGGVSFGAGVAWHPASGAFGVELRADSGAIDVNQESGQFRVTVRPPAPLPPVSLDLETEGSITLGRLLPISLNVRYRGGGRVGLVASAGLSYLPSLDFTVTQELGIGAIAGVGGIDLPTVPLTAGGQIGGFWGANAGVGLRIRLSDSVSANVEGRGFFFGERELEWEIDRFPLSPELGEALRQQIGPIRFTPGFFQATAGLSVRF
jgi:hypothetical protein